VSKRGPSTVTGATVADSFPGIFTNDTFTSTASSGASGKAASGTGNIRDSVTMASGSTITYTVTGTVSPTASGSLVNTATVTAPPDFTDGSPANNPTPATDPPRAPADL